MFDEEPESERIENQRNIVMVKTVILKHFHESINTHFSDSFPGRTFGELGVSDHFPNIFVLREKRLRTTKVYKVFSCSHGLIWYYPYTMGMGRFNEPKSFTTEEWIAKFDLDKEEVLDDNS